ncbi:MAG: hypothetical protein RMJ98_07450 [Myxococcales bacterium]|nr:hypothetical protein [Myxococcales bacterium]
MAPPTTPHSRSTSSVTSPHLQGGCLPPLVTAVLWWVTGEARALAAKARLP